MKSTYSFRATVLSVLATVISFSCSLADDYGNRQFVKKEHSLVKPYQGSGMSIPNWDFTGSTMVSVSLAVQVVCGSKNFPRFLPHFYNS